MKTLLGWLPHLCIAVNIALLVVVILDRFNPMIDLLRGGLFTGLLLASVISAVGTSYVLISRRGWR